jgi:hypothetical protein
MGTEREINREERTKRSIITWAIHQIISGDKMTVGGYFM